MATCQRLLAMWAKAPEPKTLSTLSILRKETLASMSSRITSWPRLFSTCSKVIRCITTNGCTHPANRAEWIITL